MIYEIKNDIIYWSQLAFFSSHPLCLLQTNVLGYKCLQVNP